MECAPDNPDNNNNLLVRNFAHIRLPRCNKNTPPTILPRHSKVLVLAPEY